MFANVAPKMNEIIRLVKAKQETQIKCELHMNKLQEPVDVLGTECDKFKKDKK